MSASDASKTLILPPREITTLFRLTLLLSKNILHYASCRGLMAFDAYSAVSTDIMHVSSTVTPLKTYPYPQ